MFGRNKMSQGELESLKVRNELDERFFQQVDEDKEMFDANLAEIEESYRQVETNANQVCENMKSAAAFAQENAKVEAALLHSLGDCVERLGADGTRQQQMLEQFEKVAGEAARLVDENKHFTSPSKYLSEYPGNLRSQNHSYMQSLNQMADYGKQMGVLALNAAIEAGRMGDAGRQFVTAAEDIRTYASGYDKSVRELKAQLEQSDKRIDELEEQVRHMVSLLKDNNMSTAKLMKSCNEVVAKAKQEQSEDFAKEVASFKDQVTILKNADEEIIKSEERNRMQMEDLTEEFAAQQRNQKEIFGVMDPVFRHIVERKA